MSVVLARYIALGASTHLLLSKADQSQGRVPSRIEKFTLDSTDAASNHIGFTGPELTRHLFQDLMVFGSKIHLHRSGFGNSTFFHDMYSCFMMYIH